ncbi:hypothetical protein J8F10_09170 [Gemmata sp. G18]|uniref:Uncharacterized protein n=1 Tax=Gemmata palustris TaxID=2822762 RepID=A0ABS5BP77_9BACT|nr:hypothetical protein [Gemmata palustris]MBP3955451.1 hypothetical protein [Gemmata palustris]
MLCDRIASAKWHTEASIRSQVPTELEPVHLIVDAHRASDITNEQARDMLEKAGFSQDQLRAYFAALDRQLAIMNSCDGKTAFRLLDGSMSEERHFAFREDVARAQRFALTRAFADASLTKLATPQTVADAAKWFRLSHDPMWMEWEFSDHPAHHFGALLTAAGDDGRGVQVRLADAAGVGYLHVTEGTIWPDTVRLAEGGDCKVEVDGELERWPGMALLIVDYVVRINSPRITETRPCDDLTALNHKRSKNGKPPLFSHHIVDLNKQVKAGLRLAERFDADEAAHGKRRLHWRRGHFKCCRTGVFWWNPHLAGKAELGLIEKDYVA